MRLLLGVLSALALVDYRPTLRLCMYTLWPALAIFFCTGQPGWFSLVGLPLVTAVYCKLCLELAIPQLGRYRENLNNGKYPQASFHAVKALQKLEERSSLNYLNILRPRLSHPNLQDHLESELAALKLLQGEVPEAERRLRKLIDSGRAEAIVYHNMAVALSELGRWEEARHFVRVARGLGVSPPYPITRRKAFWSRLLPGYKDAHLQWIWDVAGFYRKLGLHQLALACCQHVHHSALILARVHSLLAVGNVSQAQDLALQAVQDQASNARHQLALCLVRLSQERYEEAFQLAQTSIELDPEWPLARRLSYEIEIWLADEEDLLDLLAWVEEYETHRALRLTTQALIQYRLGNWHTCLEKASRVVATPGESVVLNGVVGIALARLGQPDRAVPLIRDFLAYTHLKPYPMAHLERRRAAAQLVLDSDLCDV